MKIFLINAAHVIKANREICLTCHQPHQCLNFGKIESALHSTFFPGTPPFAYGGIGRLAGILCYNITMAHAFSDGNKRTAATISSVFLELNDYELEYPESKEGEMTILTKSVIQCAKGDLSKGELAEWFDLHKRRIQHL